MVREFADFVNGQAEFHEAMAKKFVHDKNRLDKHLTTARQFRSLHAALMSAGQGQQSTSAPANGPVQLDLTFEEVEGLPAELVQELSISDGDRTEFVILKIIRELGGIASLDRILVGLYRQTNEIMKRTTLTSRIYRMTQKGLLYSVPNRKGVYSTRELTPEDVEKLIA